MIDWLVGFLTISTETHDPGIRSSKSSMGALPRLAFLAVVIWHVSQNTSLSSLTTMSDHNPCSCARSSRRSSMPESLVKQILWNLYPFRVDDVEHSLLVNFLYRIDWVDIDRVDYFVCDIVNVDTTSINKKVVVPPQRFHSATENNRRVSLDT